MIVAGAAASCRSGLQQLQHSALLLRLGAAEGALLCFCAALHLHLGDLHRELPSQLVFGQKNTCGH